MTRRRFVTDVSGVLLAMTCSAAADVGSAEAAAKRGRVIAACTKYWPDNAGDCSTFVRKVASDLQVPLSGQANDICRQIAEPPWITIGTGAGAATAAGVSASEGKLVVGCSTGSKNGHVAIIVDYRNAFDGYAALDRRKAVAFWGQLHSVGGKYARVTQSWAETDMMHVLFAYHTLG